MELFSQNLWNSSPLFWRYHLKIGSKRLKLVSYTTGRWILKHQYLLRRHYLTTGTVRAKITSETTLMPPSSFAQDQQICTIFDAILPIMMSELGLKFQNLWNLCFEVFWSNLKLTTSEGGSKGWWGIRDFWMVLHKYCFVIDFDLSIAVGITIQVLF